MKSTPRLIPSKSFKEARTQANSAEDTEERVGAPHKNCVEYHFEGLKVRGRRITSVLACALRLVQRISNEEAEGPAEPRQRERAEKRKFSATEAPVRRTCFAVPRVAQRRRGFSNHALQSPAHQFAVWHRSADVLHNQCLAIVMPASRLLCSLPLFAILRACRNQAYLLYGHSIGVTLLLQSRHPALHLQSIEVAPLGACFWR